MRADFQNIIAINVQKNILILRVTSYENPNEELGKDVIILIEKGEYTDVRRTAAT